MKFKSLAIVILVLFLVSSMTAGEKEFQKGSWYLSPQIALYSYALNFGANLEVAITENIGVGGTVMLAFWGDDWFSYTLITPSVEALYHFTKIKANKLDLFAGAAAGYSIYNYSDKNGGAGGGTGASGIFLTPVGGARYWFKPNLAAYAKLQFSLIGDFSGIGGVVGVTFVVKKD